MMKLVAATFSPLLALFGVRVWLEAKGPAVASAQATTEAIVVPTYSALPTLSGRQAAMKERVHALDEQMPSSPFPANRKTELVIADPEFPPIEPGDDHQTPEVEPPPQIVVSAVMGGRVPVAMVNGRPRSVGDEVQPGWTVLQITQSGVVIVHTDGRTATFTIQRGTP